MRTSPMIWAMPVLSAFVLSLGTGCANLQPPPDTDAWMVCIDTPTAVECVVNDGGEIKRIKIPHVETDKGT